MATARTGSITPAGALAAGRLLTLVLSGAVTATGGLVRQIGKRVGGLLTPLADLLREWVGVVRPGRVTVSAGLVWQVGLEEESVWRVVVDHTLAAI
jgi:hypothetical protein